MKNFRRKSIIYLGLVGIAYYLCSCKKKDPEDKEILINSSGYTPSSITVPSGTKVTWTNKDDLIHTVTSNNPLFDSGDLSKGKTYSYTFNSTGTFPYHCKHHSQMTGTVIVQ